VKTEYATPAIGGAGIDRSLADGPFGYLAGNSISRLDLITGHSRQTAGWLDEKGVA
jgi:hypothetical protein